VISISIFAGGIGQSRRPADHRGVRVEVKRRVARESSVRSSSVETGHGYCATPQKIAVDKSATREQAGCPGRKVVAGTGLTIDDQWDCADVLFKYRQIIVDAYLGRFLSDPEGGAVRALRNLGSVLGQDGQTLNPDLHEVLDSVLAAGRPVADLLAARDLWGKVASRSGEWLAGGMTSPWRSAAHSIKANRS
jgi:hypothetical protein